MQLVKANTYRKADLPNRFGMRKSLAVGGEVEKVADRQQEESDRSTTALVSQNSKDGSASNPNHANLASNNPVLAHSLRSNARANVCTREPVTGIVSNL
jgi:hypothetical protein